MNGQGMIGTSQPSTIGQVMTEASQQMPPPPPGSVSIRDVVRDFITTVRSSRNLLNESLSSLGRQPAVNVVPEACDPPAQNLDQELLELKCLVGEVQSLSALLREVVGE